MQRKVYGVCTEVSVANKDLRAYVSVLEPRLTKVLDLRGT